MLVRVGALITRQRGFIELAELFRDGDVGGAITSDWREWYQSTDTSTPVDAEGQLVAHIASPNGVAWIQTDADARMIAGRAPLRAGVVRNLLVDTEALATQDVEVTEDQYTLSFTGEGYVMLSGASSEGPLVGTSSGDIVSYTFTPDSAGTLTLTVEGDVLKAQLNRGSSRGTYQRVGADRWDVSQQGVPDTRILYTDLEKHFYPLDLPAGDYSIAIAGEEGVFFHRVTHAGGDFEIGPPTWTNGPEDGIEKLIGRRIIEVVVRDRDFSGSERAKLLHRWVQMGAPGYASALERPILTSLFYEEPGPPTITELFYEGYPPTIASLTFVEEGRPTITMLEYHEE